MLLAPVVRFALALLVTTACQVGQPDRFSGVGGGGGSGSGSGSNAPAECAIDHDCALAAATCCACPTFALSADDPAVLACNAVQCPASSCPANVRAACVAGACTIACVAMTCAATCADGFAEDATGCLSCTCATTASECTIDSDCERVRADCCGCARGGRDTAVPKSLADAHDNALGCPANPACPTVDTCAPGLAPQCVRGRCELVSGALPPNACGRADLPACAAGQHCAVNVDPAATAAGVGVCLPD